LSIRPEEVAKYLKDHPEFFEEYAELLSSIQVRHPHGKHAIPLSERQVLTLRERSRALEGKLRELVQFGEENDTLSDRVHRISLALMAAHELPEVLQAIHLNLREDFRVPAVALRLWAGEPDRRFAEYEPVSQEMRVFAESLANPYFCDRLMFESGGWFSGAGAAQPNAADDLQKADPEQLNSLIYVPIRAERPFGVLALGSSDAGRFSADMGTLYVVRLGELISMALRRYLDVRSDRP